MIVETAVCAVCRVVCFFQAEDGIRDLVRSRGLGDVYKRQGASHVGRAEVELRAVVVEERRVTAAFVLAQHIHPVSYTHLTLPTSDLV